MSEGYLAGGDTELDLTTIYAMGQTFSPLVVHKLEYIDITCRTHGHWGHFHGHVYDLDKDPNMIGGGISTIRYVNTERKTGEQLRRIRFIMKKRYLHIGKTYGFWFHFDPEPVWDKYKCLYDADDAAYPRGQRFTKDSWLGPPTYYPNDDLMFFEFGTPVAKPVPPDPEPWPPPTPPDPTIENWMIIQGAQRRTETGERITAYTNVPCHLWLRWTVVKPRTHTKTKRTRGLRTMTDLQFCFDVFTDYPQQEPGDTLEHTFIVEPWPLCELRYFYFHGTVNGTPSPSTSPIFTKHPIYPPGKNYFYPDGHPEVTSVDGVVYRLIYPYETWSDIRSKPGNKSYDDSWLALAIGSGEAPDTYSQLRRLIILFDTSTIPKDAQILEATLRLSIGDVIETLIADWSFTIVSSTPLSNTALVPEDYQHLGSQPLSDILPKNAFVAGSSVTFTLNATGLAAISRGGITKLGIREYTYDISNLAPPWAFWKWARWRFYSGESPGEIRPRLEVNWQ